MIEDLNKVLHSLFQAQMTGLIAGTPPSVSNDQIRFQPPDADLVSHVSGLGTRPALNAYLVDLREDRISETTQLKTGCGSRRPCQTEWIAIT
jgi:hypothetical protein